MKCSILAATLLWSAVVQARSSLESSFDSCKISLVRTSTDSRIVAHSFDDPSQSFSKETPVPEVGLDTSLQLSCSLNAPVNAAFLSFESSTADSFTVPVRIRPSKGRYSLRLDMPFSSRAPTELLQMDSDITYTLSVASFDAPTPQDQLVLPLGTFKWNDSVKRMAEQETAKAQENTPSEWDVTRWSVRPELSWTFGKIETGPSLTWGVIGTIFTLGLPVVTLLTLLSYVLPNLDFDMITASGAGLLLGLSVLECLILAYWFHFRIFTILPLLFIAAIPTALVGRQALREKAAQKQA